MRPRTPSCLYFLITLDRLSFNLFCAVVLTLVATQANLESCKMEVKIMSPVDGICLKIQVKEGAVVDAYDTLMLIRPHSAKTP